jgi:hypothetical protein
MSSVLGVADIVELAALLAGDAATVATVHHLRDVEGVSGSDVSPATKVSLVGLRTPLTIGRDSLPFGTIESDISCSERPDKTDNGPERAAPDGSESESESEIRSFRFFRATDVAVARSEPSQP